MARLSSGRKKGFRSGGLFCFAPHQIMTLLAFLMLSSCQAEANANAESRATLAKVVQDTVPAGTIPADTAQALQAPVAPSTYTFVGVGDMMLGTNYPSASYLPPQGGTTMLAHVEDLLKDADVTDRKSVV